MQIPKTMISISRKKNNPSKVLVIIALLLLPLSIFAQDNLTVDASTASPSISKNKQTISISPTIFEASANPGQLINSDGIRVINPNSYELEVFVDVVNFEAQGESGQGKFIPVEASEDGGNTIAEWITIKNKSIVIPAEKTIQIPFSISVPEDAPPGGHFAAILIGTKSLPNDNGQMKVETSQVVTSLVFLRVAGDVVESGSIREFRSTQLISESPKVTFELRFENKGNVHIQPQGDIKIYNMWGQERGVIPVNRQMMFGNVLPMSVRKYSFTWSGQWSVADMGRYTAIATLGYGKDSRQFVTSQTNFWVIPWKILGAILLVLFGFFAFVSWAIKLYIRKMLAIAGVSTDLHEIKQKVKVNRRPRVSMVAPIEAGILDLSDRLKDSNSWWEKLKATTSFLRHYKVFFIVVIMSILFLSVVTMYIKSASVPERAYEVTIEGLGDSAKISSEQIFYDKLVTESGIGGENINKNVSEFPAISLLNQSGVTGLAAQLKLDLEKKGYVVQNLANDLDISKVNTVIVYEPEFAEQALELSKDINGALLSAFDGPQVDGTPITVYVGQDYENKVQ